MRYLTLSIGLLRQIRFTFLINSLRPSDAYMRRWTGSSLVQILACRLYGDRPLSEPMLEYCYWAFRNKLQWNFNRNSNIFIQKIAFKTLSAKLCLSYLGLNELNHKFKHYPSQLNTCVAICRSKHNVLAAKHHFVVLSYPTKVHKRIKRSPAWHLTSTESHYFTTKNVKIHICPINFSLVVSDNSL